MSVARQRAASCSRLAALGLVAAGCLAFSGVAQASPPPDPNTIGGTTISHIELNGVLGTEITVTPAQDVKIKANWEDHNTGCETCVDYLATGFAGNPPAGCIEFNSSFGNSGTEEVDLGSAPSKGGTFNVVAQFEEGFECGEGWNASESGGYQVIARVTVPSTTPTSIEQCKKNGWKNFGTMFKNQGQCVKFVETHH